MTNSGSSIQSPPMAQAGSRKSAAKVMRQDVMLSYVIDDEEVSQPEMWDRSEGRSWQMKVAGSNQFIKDGNPAG